MKQVVEFTANLYVDTEGLSFESAKELVRKVLAVVEKHQEFYLSLESVSRLELDEEE